jgi:hypothetical protein
MLSDEFLKGFRSAVSAYAMNTPRGAYDANRFTPRTRARHFTQRRRAADQFEEELTNRSDDDRLLPDELLEIIRRQVDPDTYQWLCDVLNDTANNQDSDEEEEDGMSSEPANDQPPKFSGRPTPNEAPPQTDEACFRVDGWEHNSSV